MKDWWLNLALREKQMVLAGGLALLLFLLYEMIWSPLIDKNAALRTQIQHNRELLAWMENADQRMKSLLQSAKSRDHQTGSLSGIVQDALHNSPLRAHVNQFRQVESDSVQFDLRKVNFDELIKFLTGLWNNEGILVAQFSVAPSGTPGEVTASIVLKPKFGS